MLAHKLTVSEQTTKTFKKEHKNQITKKKPKKKEQMSSVEEQTPPVEEQTPAEAATEQTPTQQEAPQEDGAQAVADAAAEGGPQTITAAQQAHATAAAVAAGAISAQAAAAAAGRPLSASLYVGDLDADVGESLLFDIFKKVGPVASIRVCRDSVTRRSLGYAYVNFHNVVDAERALNLINYQGIKGRPCRIMWSHRDPSIRKSGVGNIFIKNLDKDIDNKNLYDTFSDFGNILSCKVETDEHGNSKGYGYVHYETQEEAESAIETVNKMEINNKIVYVGPFVPKRDRQPVNPAETFTNVYVKNLPETVDDAQLNEMFSKFGKVNSACVMQDADGSRKGFGFVNFEEHEHAVAAVEALNMSKMGEKQLYVGRAQKRAERESRLREKFKKMKEERMNKYQGVNLYVKNLDDTIDDEKLRQEFSAYGSITSAKIMTDDKSNSKGFGFVCFTKPEEATKALTEMNGRMVANKPIYVALAQPKDVRRAQLEAHHAQRQQSMRMQQAPGMGMPSGIYPTGAPVFYPQAAGMPPQRAQPLMYPQQVVHRGWPPQRAGPAAARQYQPLPNAYQMPAGGASSRGQTRQRGQQTRGQGQSAQTRGQQQNRRNFKYNTNVRNTVRPEQLMPHMMPAPFMTPDMIMPTNPVEPLTPQRLAAATPDERKQMLGDSLFPLVHAQQPQTAPKITGMILQSIEEPAELLHLIEDPQALTEKINEAVDVLKNHTEQPAEAADATPQA